MKRISYDEYLDKVTGCFLGKALSGTIGAPFEGVKMPMAITFKEKMIDSMLPNDDLDLQVLWLDVLKEKGYDFTSYDLLDRFCNYCTYSPGEYAIMRKNYEYGIYPPYSGSFNNDFYRGGMGCPIRSEIWACVAVGNTALATEFASRDGVLDHEGESVYAEEFLAALEANAFFEDDIRGLITKSLDVVPKNSKFYSLVCDTVDLVDKYHDIKAVFACVLDKYGHRDCTNMLQNLSIIISALLIYDKDIIKASMAALNCGFDTDCTCATLGSIIGIILGAERIYKELGIKDLTYVLSVKSDRRSDRISDLALDVATIGVKFAKTVNKETEIYNCKCDDITFVKDNGVRMDIEYLNEPSISPVKPCEVKIVLSNLELSDGVLSIDYPEYFVGDNNIEIKPVGGKVTVALNVRMKDADVYYKKNIVKVNVIENDKVVFSSSFGICAADVFRVDGPYWRTEPAITPEELDDGRHYSRLFVDDDNCKKQDKIREFHLNCAVDSTTDYVDVDRLFDKFSPGYNGKSVSKYFYRDKDTFHISDFSSFNGPAVYYLSQIVLSDEDREAYLLIGRSGPVSVYFNGNKIAAYHDCTSSTKENIHLKVNLKKGENRLVLRLTKANSDTEFSVIFGKNKPACGAHITELGYKKI